MLSNRILFWGKGRSVDFTTPNDTSLSGTITRNSSSRFLVMDNGYHIMAIGNVVYASTDDCVSWSVLTTLTGVSPSSIVSISKVDGLNFVAVWYDNYSATVNEDRLLGAQINIRTASATTSGTVIKSDMDSIYSISTAVDSDGTVHVSFSGKDSFTTLWRNIFYVSSPNGGLSWETAERLTDYNTANPGFDIYENQPYGSAVSFDSNNRPIVVFKYYLFQFTSPNPPIVSSVIFSRYFNGSTWDTGGVQGGTNGTQQDPMLVRQSTGRVICLWRGDLGVTLPNALASSYTDNGVNWTDQDLSTTIVGEASGYVDRDDNIVAVYEDSDGDIYTATSEDDGVNYNSPVSIVTGFTVGNISVCRDSTIQATVNPIMFTDSNVYLTGSWITP